MKYLTRGWTVGEHTDQESERIRSEYWQRIEVLRPRMPPSIARLATETVLHDALINRVELDRRTRSLTLELVCGSTPSDCVGIAITYQELQLSQIYIDILAERARDRRTQILYDEIDQDEDGVWIHRLLFWPIGEINISFGGLELTHSPCPDKRWNCVGCDPFVTVE